MTRGSRQPQRIWVPKGVRALAVGVSLLLIAAGADGDAEAPAPSTPTRIAFTGPELVKLDWGVPAVTVGDVNGDGLLDLVSPNPAKARIECLLQRSAGEPAPSGTADAGNGNDDANVLPDDPRFERRPLAVELRVYSAVSADFSGDGRDDLAYYGEPNKLILVEQTEEGRWGPRHTFELTDGSRNPGGLAAGDFDGDGRTDIALVGRNVLHLICHEEGGQLAPAKKIPSSAEGSGFLLADDFNGDGRLDVAYPVTQEDMPLCFRLQDLEGTLGPEQFAEVPRFRAAASLHRGDEAAATLGLVLATSGRLELRHLALGEDTGAASDQASPFVYPLEEDKADRRFVVCDVDGDGRVDVVATYPSTAQVGVLFQREAGGLRQPSLYPSLSGVSELVVGDLDGDGRPELLLLSKEEETIGFSRWEASETGPGRLGFPEAVPLPGRPQAVAAGDVDDDGRDEVLYVRKEEKTYRLAWRGLEESGGFSDEQSFELTGLDTDVSALIASDLSGDGHLDVLVSLSFGPARLLLGDGTGGFRDTAAEGGPSQSLLRRLSPGSTNLADVDGDGRVELLVADKNFARAVTVSADGWASVVEQANGRNARSQIVSAAVADLDGDGVVEVALLDSWGKELTVLHRLADGTLGEPLSIPLGGMPAQKVRVAAGDLTGDARPDLIVLGQSAIGLASLEGPRHTFELAGAYESDTEEANVGDLVAGDLFADGSDEVVLTDIRNHNLELLRWDGSGDLRRIYRFTVFEKKLFQGRERGGNEPRQALLADLTGDGRTDIVLLVHDRIVLYPQAAVGDPRNPDADDEGADDTAAPSVRKGGEE